MNNQYIITAQTIIEYEKWFNDYIAYLSDSNNVGLYISDERVNSFQGVPIKGQDYCTAIGGYNVRLGSPNFDGLYNYLKHKLNHNKKGNSK